MKRPLPERPRPPKLPKISDPVSISFDTIPENIRLHPDLGKITSLNISLEYEENSPEIDLAAEGLCFPELRELELSCVNLKSLTFTEANTPKLVSAQFSNLLSGCRMNLALPYLKYLDIEHAALYEESEADINQFGLSLSRCPSLCKFNSYKFRCLGDLNFCILPNCRSITLHRSECTNHLEIWYAPKLAVFSVQAAYELKHLRLYNRPTTTVEAIEKLTTKLQEANRKVNEAVNEELNKWNNGEYTTEDAIRRFWIEPDEEFDLENEVMQDILADYAYTLSDDLTKEYHAPILRKATANHPDYPWDPNHPKCTVCVANMSLDSTSKENLNGIPFVQLQKLNPYDMSLMP